MRNCLPVKECKLQTIAVSFIFYPDGLPKVAIDSMAELQVQ